MKQNIYPFIVMILLISCVDQKKDLLAIFPPMTTGCGESISFYNMHNSPSPSLIKEHIYAYPVKAVQLDQMYENMTYDEVNNEVILLGVNSATGDYKLVVVSLNAI